MKVGQETCEEKRIDGLVSRKIEAHDAVQDLAGRIYRAVRRYEAGLDIAPEMAELKEAVIDHTGKWG